jgi:hypothetical protein
MITVEEAKREVERLSQTLTRQGLRFAVGRSGSVHSSIWRTSWSKSDYYISARSIFGSMKISLHESRICRLALTERYMTWLREQGLAPPDDRAFVKWRRPPAPESGAHLAVVLVFPTDNLHLDDPAWKNSNKPLLHFEPAPSGKAVELGFFYSREAKETLEPRFMEIGKPLHYADLPNGEFVWLVGREADFDPTCIPTAEFDTARGSLDVLSLGTERRGLTVILWNSPEAGEPLRVIELGGTTVTRTGGRRLVARLDLPAK